MQCCCGLHASVATAQARAASVGGSASCDKARRSRRGGNVAAGTVFFARLQKSQNSGIFSALTNQNLRAVAFRLDFAAKFEARLSNVCRLGRAVAGVLVRLRAAASAFGGCVRRRVERPSLAETSGERDLSEIETANFAVKVALHPSPYFVRDGSPLAMRGQRCRRHRIPRQQLMSPELHLFVQWKNVDIE